jgi:transposase
MRCFAGLDISVQETSICVVDDEGRIVREAKVVTEPAAIIAALTRYDIVYGRVGLEAGPLSQWLYSALAEGGLAVSCVETRHMKAALSAQTNKSDRNDARGIAQMMRVGLYRPVHVKTRQSQERRMLLTSRRLLRSTLLDIENELRGVLRNFGLKVGAVSRRHFEARIRELVAVQPRLAAIAAAILAVRTAPRTQTDALHKMLLDLVRDDPVCRRFMTVPGPT